MMRKYSLTDTEPSSNISLPLTSATDSKETTVRVPTDDEGAVAALAPKSRKDPPEEFSFYRRFKIQGRARHVHYELFRTEYYLVYCFVLVTFITTIAGLAMQYFDGTTVLSRLFLTLGPMSLFGVFIGFFKGIPEGPPFLARKDGTILYAPYAYKGETQSYHEITSSGAENFSQPSRSENQPTAPENQ